MTSTTNHPRARGGSSPEAGLARRSLLALLAVMVAVVVAGIGVAAPKGAQAAETADVATDALNLRDAPSTEGEILAVLVTGESMEVLSGPSDDGWYEVASGGQTGWVTGEYLSFGGVGGDDSGRWIDIDRSSQRVTLYAGGETVASYWAAMGIDSSDDGYYATALGTYYVDAMNADLTWSEPGQVYFTHWIAFDPERDNGFHSWSMDEDGSLIEGSDSPTGGCVALEPSAAAAVFEFAEVGMRVEVHW